MIPGTKLPQTGAARVSDTGTVLWFSTKKGFGFIQSSSGEEVFVHYSSITGRGYRVLQPGDKVKFEKLSGPKGSQAFHVELVS
jgi:CspA family cold shock protein